MSTYTFINMHLFAKIANNSRMLRIIRRYTVYKCTSMVCTGWCAVCIYIIVHTGTTWHCHRCGGGNLQIVVPPSPPGSVWLCRIGSSVWWDHRAMRLPHWRHREVMWPLWEFHLWIRPSQWLYSELCTLCSEYVCTSTSSGLLSTGFNTLRKRHFT